MKSNREEAWDDLIEVISQVIDKLPEETRLAKSDRVGYFLEDRLPEQLAVKILDEFVLIRK